MLDPISFSKRFSAVDEFFIEDLILSSGVVTGYAAPSGGPKCCVLAIASRDKILAISRASSFSVAAQEKNIRLGWSGFHISGLAQALATGADPQLKCLVSDKILRQWSCVELLEILKPEASNWTDLQDVRARLQLEQGCSDVQQILDFAMDFRAKQGPEAFLNASYRYFFQRDVDNVGRAQLLQSFPNVTSILMCWKEIMLSSEFTSRKRGALAGPFEAGFPFSLSILDFPSIRSRETVVRSDPSFKVM